MPMTQSATLRNFTAAAALAVTLAACASGGTPNDNMGSFLVAPDKFVLYNCQQLAERAVAVAARQKELEALMAKAGPEPGGRLASAVAYDPEYAELRGDANELRRASGEKNCKSMPGAAPAVSGGAIR
jgi:hypothetical protein